MIREVREESGLEIRNPQLRGVLTFPAFSKGEDWYVFLYTATRFSGSLIESDEGRLEWIADEELPELPLWEGDTIFLKWLNKKSFFSGKFVYDNGRLKEHSVVFYPPEQV